MSIEFTIFTNLVSLTNNFSQVLILSWVDLYVQLELVPPLLIGIFSVAYATRQQFALL